MADDVQDSDEETEDSGGESEEDDEGSLYAPTEITSDLGGEEPGKDDDSMELRHKNPCKFLSLLPRELRDKVCT